VPAFNSAKRAIENHQAGRFGRLLKILKNQGCNREKITSFPARSFLKSWLAGLAGTICNR
jgi:hypothetical protein